MLYPTSKIEGPRGSGCRSLKSNRPGRVRITGDVDSARFKRVYISVSFMQICCKRGWPLLYEYEIRGAAEATAVRWFEN